MFEVLTMPFDDYLNGKYEIRFTGIIMVFDPVDFVLERKYRLLIDDVVYTDSERWFDDLNEEQQTQALFYLDVWR